MPRKLLLSEIVEVAESITVDEATGAGSTYGSRQSSVVTLRVRDADGNVLLALTPDEKK